MGVWGGGRRRGGGWGRCKDAHCAAVKDFSYVQTAGMTGGGGGGGGGGQVVASCSKDLLAAFRPLQSSGAV